jgi:hypothetical protein
MPRDLLVHFRAPNALQVPVLELGLVPVLGPLLAQLPECLALNLPLVILIPALLTLL